MHSWAIWAKVAKLKVGEKGRKREIEDGYVGLQPGCFIIFYLCFLFPAPVSCGSD
jgi:hypothetical protein